MSLNLNSHLQYQQLMLALVVHVVDEVQQLMSMALVVHSLRQMAHKLALPAHFQLPLDRRPLTDLLATKLWKVNFNIKHCATT